jgi:hypothetical protein
MRKESTRELFDAVDLHGRSVIIWQKGELLGTIDRYKHKVRLYLVEDFYVELFYRPIEKRIFRIERSDSRSLKKFLHLIELPDLTDL